MKGIMEGVMFSSVIAQWFRKGGEIFDMRYIQKF